MPPSSQRSAVPPASSSAKLQRHLRRTFRDNVQGYAEDLAACHRRLNRPAVHRLRVAIRRLLASLELLETTRKERPPARGALRRQLKALGALRDVQNQIQRVGSERQVAAALESLPRDLRRRSRRRARRVRETLASGRALRRLREWSRLRVQWDPRANHRVQRLVDRRLRQMCSRLAASAPPNDSDSRQRHRLRVLAREFVFLVDALPAACRGGGATEFLARLRAHQKAIGQIHDRELLLHRLDRLVAAGKVSARSARPFRALLGLEKRRLLKSCHRLHGQVVNGAPPARTQFRQGLRPG